MKETAKETTIVIIICLVALALAYGFGVNPSKTQHCIDDTDDLKPCVKCCIATPSNWGFDIKTMDAEDYIDRCQIGLLLKD